MSELEYRLEPEEGFRFPERPEQASAWSGWRVYYRRKGSNASRAYWKSFLLDDVDVSREAVETAIEFHETDARRLLEQRRER